MTELYHKNLVSNHGEWKIGVEFSDCMLIERNHRHNYIIYTKKRTNFPRIGHYDTWLVEIMQTLYEENHDITLFQDWSNTLDYVDTVESFRIIALHADIL